MNLPEWTESTEFTDLRMDSLVFSDLFKDNSRIVSKSCLSKNTFHYLKLQFDLNKSNEEINNVINDLEFHRIYNKYIKDQFKNVFLQQHDNFNDNNAYYNNDITSHLIDINTGEKKYLTTKERYGYSFYKYKDYVDEYNGIIYQKRKIKKILYCLSEEFVDYIIKEECKILKIKEILKKIKSEIY